MTVACPSCRRSADLQAHMSVLDFKTRFLCEDCIDHNAELSMVIADAIARDWSALPAEIRQAVTVYHAGEYVSPATWSERIKAARAEEDDELIDQAQDMARKIANLQLTTLPLQRPRRWFRFMQLGHAHA